MNLKEAFRYQSFLTSLLDIAARNYQMPNHCLITTKRHLKKNANPEAEDVTEVVEVEPFVSNDVVKDFFNWIINQKVSLGLAITGAKKSLDFDLDAAVSANKARQKIASSIAWGLNYVPSKTVSKEKDYKFNVEGNQTPYYYDVETETDFAFDTAAAKEFYLHLMEESDETSEMIDRAMVNTKVDYTPRFNVNKSYRDIIAEFEQQNK